MSLGFSNIIETYSGSQSLLSEIKNISFIKGEREKETNQKEREKGGKKRQSNDTQVIISDVEKVMKLSWWVLHAGEEKKKKEIHPKDMKNGRLQFCGHTSCLLKPLEAQMHMFKCDYSCFSTLNLSLGRGQKN